MVFGEIGCLSRMSGALCRVELVRRVIVRALPKTTEEETMHPPMLPLLEQDQSHTNPNTVQKNIWFQPQLLPPTPPKPRLQQTLLVQQQVKTEPVSQCFCSIMEHCVRRSHSIELSRTPRKLESTVQRVEHCATAQNVADFVGSITS